MARYCGERIGRWRVMRQQASISAEVVQRGGAVSARLVMMRIPLEVIDVAVMFGWQRVVVVDGYRVLLEERSCIDTLITMPIKRDGLQMFRHHMRCNTRMQKCLRQSPTCDGEYRHVLYDAQRYTTQSQPQRRLFFD